MLRPFFKAPKDRSRRNPTRGHRAASSLRPMAEVMEGRQLMTAIYSNSASAVEHGTAPVTMTFTVALTGASTQPVTVNYQTSDITAISGTDYVATSGTLTFAPGSTTATIPVTILPDPAATSSKVFYLNLSNPQGATLSSPKLAGVITEQNTLPPASLTVNNPTVNVGTGGVGGTLTFTVSLNEPDSTPVSVTASTSNLTAVAGVDYVAESQVLTFAPGQTAAQFTVSIIGETEAATKYFLVDLTLGSVAIGKSQNAGTIVY